MATTGILYRRNSKANLILDPPVVGEIVFALDTEEYGALENGIVKWDKHLGPITTRGDIVTGDTSGKPSRLPVGNAGQVLGTSDGVDVTWISRDPLTTRGDVLIRNAANISARLGVGTAGQVLGTDGIDVTWVDAGPTLPTLDTPIITGGISGTELTTIVLTVTNYDALNTYISSVNFGSVVDNTDGTFTVTLPDYSVSTAVIFSVRATQTNYISSSTATHNIAVVNTVIATPVITGDAAGTENLEVVLTVTNYDVGNTYFSSVDFGTLVDNLDGTFVVTLPDFAVSTSVNFSIYATNLTDTNSVTAVHNITVNNTILATPILTGATTGQEATVVVVTVSNYNPLETYVPSVGFGSVVDNSDGTFSVTLPAYSLASAITFSIYTTKAGDVNSATATRLISVTEIPTLATPTFSGAVSGQESTDVIITVTNYDALNVYVPSVNFGSVVDNTDGTFTVTLPLYSSSTTVQFSLYATRIGYTNSLVGTRNISVTLPGVLDTPIVTGLSSSLESSVVVLTITNYDNTVTYNASTNIGSIVDNLDGTFTVTLPDYATSTIVQFSVYGTRAGDINSLTATRNISVTNTVLATPILTGATTGPETTVVVVTTTNYDVSYTYVPSVNFGSVVDNTDGTFDVTLPLFATNPSVIFSLYATRAGDITSATSTHTITVTQIADVVDTALINADFAANVLTNDGFTY